MVPGWMDTPKILQPAAEFLRTHGEQPHIVSPQPSDGSLPIEALAEQVAAYIQTEFDAAQPINLYGYSMGGLICRTFLQKMDGWRRVAAFVTVSTPHHGTAVAWLDRGPAGQQMRLNSPFVRSLNDDLAPLSRVRFTSIWTPLDLMIVPAASSRLPVGSMRRVLVPAHVLMLTDGRVLKMVLEALRGEAPHAPAHSSTL